MQEGQVDEGGGVLSALSQTEECFRSGLACKHKEEAVGVDKSKMQDWRRKGGLLGGQ